MKEMDHRHESAMKDKDLKLATLQLKEASSSYKRVKLDQACASTSAETKRWEQSIWRVVILGFLMWLVTGFLSSARR